MGEPVWSRGRPTQVGVYRVKTRFGGMWFRFWNGIQWMAGCNTSEGAARSCAQCQAIGHNDDEWTPL